MIKLSQIPFLFILLFIIFNGCGSSQSSVKADRTSVEAEIEQAVVHKDTMAVTQDTLAPVQFLKLGDVENGGASDSIPSGSAEATALENVKKHYAGALNYWFVEQNADASKQEYLAAIDALVALGDILATKEMPEDETVNGNGEIVESPF